VIATSSVARLPAGSITKAKARLEPHPRHGPAQGGQTSVAGDKAVATGAGSDVHRSKRLFCISGIHISDTEGPRSDYQSTFIVIKAASEFKDKTTANNQLWQTDCTYLKIIGWGWF
jgi:hypothetical protein